LNPELLPGVHKFAPNYLEDKSSFKKLKARETKTLEEHRKIKPELTVARNDPIACAELSEYKLKKLRKVCSFP
jgi:hypothetical protein